MAVITDKEAIAAEFLAALPPHLVPAQYGGLCTTPPGEYAAALAMRAHADSRRQ